MPQHSRQRASRSKLEQYPNRFVIFRVAQKEIISSVSGFGLLKNGQMVLKTRLNVSLPAAKVAVIENNCFCLFLRLLNQHENRRVRVMFFGWHSKK